MCSAYPMTMCRGYKTGSQTAPAHRLHPRGDRCLCGRWLCPLSWHRRARGDLRGRCTERGQCDCRCVRGVLTRRHYQRRPRDRRAAERPVDTLPLRTVQLPARDLRTHHLVRAPFSVIRNHLIHGIDRFLYLTDLRQHLADYYVSSGGQELTQLGRCHAVRLYQRWWRKLG